jgi:hypothetical protein
MPLSTGENIHKGHARSPRSETTRPAERRAITLRARHGAAAAAGTTVVAVTGAKCQQCVYYNSRIVCIFFILMKWIFFIQGG